MMDSDDPTNKKPETDGSETKPYEGPFRGDETPSPAPDRSEGIAREQTTASGRATETPPSMATATDSNGPVKQFYRDLMDCLTEPRYFFTERYGKYTLTRALSFGIVVTWIAAFLDWITRLVRHETIFDGFLQMRQRLHELPFWKNLPDDFWAQQSGHSAAAMPAWLTEWIGIALSPFQSLISFCISGIFLFIGAYLLVPKRTDITQDPIDLPHFIKIACFISAPRLVGSILGFLPAGLGSVIAWVYGVVLLSIGISERYRISKLRSTAIIILPGVVGVFVLSCLVGVGLALLFGMFGALFSTH